MITSLQLENESPAMLKIQTDKMKVIGSFELFYPHCKYWAISQSTHSISKISWIPLINNTCVHTWSLHTLCMMGKSMNKDVHKILSKPTFDRVPKPNMQIRFRKKTLKQCQGRPCGMKRSTLTHVCKHPIKKFLTKLNN